MQKYCKAYLLQDLRRFSQWSETWEEGETPPTDETVVYLWNNLSVVKSPIIPGGVIFSDVTPAWRDFCQQELHFAIPENLRYAHTADGSSSSLSEE